MSATVEVRPALMGQLKELRLPTVRQCYEETARRAERETLSYCNASQSFPPTSSRCFPTGFPESRR